MSIYIHWEDRSTLFLQRLDIEKEWVVDFQVFENLNYLATLLFALAVLHTFVSAWFTRVAHRFPKGSFPENSFHLLGEVEAVFLLWAAVMFIVYAVAKTPHDAVEYIDARNYHEPRFVVVVMIISATRPIVDLVDMVIRKIGKLISVVFLMNFTAAFFFSVIGILPTIGSLVTEPAAMTVAAVILKRQFLDRGLLRTGKYLTTGTLFVNVSIGGAFSAYAAPPVLMVAAAWGWSTDYMIRNFGWKAGVACITSAALATWWSRKELAELTVLSDSDKHGEGEAEMRAPWWVMAVHVLALALVVWYQHHENVFLGVFVLWLGFYIASQEYQEPLRLRSSIMVGAFLAGLVTLGGLQEWWIKPLLQRVDSTWMFFGAAALTAITDNAALTYLGTLVENMSNEQKYALVAGAIAGGGTTVIANAPNPAGVAILGASFKEGNKKSFSLAGLALGALPATIIALLCFWFLPSLT